MKDPEASQIVIRELLDGGPFLREIVAADPTVVMPMKRVIEVLSQGNGHALRAGVDPQMAVLAVAGFAALVGAAHQAAEAFFEGGRSVERRMEGAGVRRAAARARGQLAAGAGRSGPWPRSRAAIRCGA